MKIDIRQAFFAFAAVLLMTVMLVDPSIAQTQAAQAGATAKGTLESLISGNIGLLIGLAITILGLWTWIIKQETGTGITMIIGGVLLTLAPGIFSGAQKMVGGVVTQFGGSSTTVSQAAKAGF